MFEHHERSAARGFTEREPRQHPSQEVEDETPPAHVTTKFRSQYDAENEEVCDHEQQWVDRRPKNAPERTSIAAEYVAAHHGPDQATVRPDRNDGVTERSHCSQQPSLTAKFSHSCDCCAKDSCFA